MKSLSYNTETRFAVYVVKILYENIPMTEMLSTLLRWSAEQSEPRRAHAQFGKINVCSFWQDRGGRWLFCNDVHVLVSLRRWIGKGMSHKT